MRFKGIALWVGCIVIGLSMMYVGGHMGAKRSLPVDWLGFHGEAVSSLFQQRNGEALIQVEKNELASFDSVNITTSNAQVSVMESDRFALEIGYFDEQPIYWEMANGILTVSDHSRNKNRVSLLDWSFAEERNAYVTVYCPAYVLRDLNVETVSGRITIADIKTGSLNSETVSGRMDIQDCTAEWMNVETVSGRIDVQDCAAASFNAEAVSGRIDLSGITGDEVVLSTVSGRISCETPRAAEQYGIQLYTVSGVLAINDERVGKKSYVDYNNTAAPYSLMATSVSGRIDLRFAS